MSIQTASQISIAFSSAIKLKGEAKLQALRDVLASVHALENRAAQDFAFPLEDIRAIKRLLPDVETGISRIEGARRAAKTRAMKQGRT